MRPLTIKVIENKELYIKWDDDVESTIELKTLRRFCPCATCSEQRVSRSSSYIPLFFEDQIKVDKIFSVGSYAVGFAWKDGHNTGIYEFPLLRQIALASNTIK